ncbi:SCO family protein [Halobacillus amylolyticus]|uniref:SCO family protein n=1 Tax=Halobacillus amylolyticus TaxID=2932259 RepID=A0ABY4HDR3_9BACI|nr:SCO family protein [Halobacillus amylolyticus]UOR12997.1 SCO family protein [Halobacillus amylolyticus]
MKYFTLVNLLILLLLTACGSPIEENMSREVKEFTATTQSGEKVNLPEDLKGEYWIADFIFTSCETVCPPMTGNMSRLQQQLKEENMDVELVSFSVDPKQDTKEKLKEFADAYQPDYEQWSFLTGYTFQEVKELSIKSFQSPLSKMEDSNQVAHGTSFYLVTPEGDVIKRYSGIKAAEMDQIISDLKKLM